MKSTLSICAKIVTVILICSLFPFVGYDDSMFCSGGSSTNMMQDISDVYYYVQKPLKDKGYKIVSTSGHFYYYNSKDFDDAEFIKHYNTTVSKDREVPSNSDGTCWATAMTSVLNYYGAKGKPENVYCWVVLQGIDDYGKGILKKGLKSNNVDDLLNKMFTKHFNMKKKATSYSKNLFKEIKNCYKSKNIGILCGDDHAMCACGYATVDCTYKDKNGKQYTTSKEFVVINWGIYKEDDNQQFFPVDKFNSKFKFVKVSNK